MKTIKKLFTVAVIALIAGTAFAQESKTSASTNGLFVTDVDKFMDVNEWSTLSPEKGFVMFDKDYTSVYSFGFAKQFSSLYWGTYFNGSLGNWQRREQKNGDNKTTTVDNGTATTTSGTEVPDSAGYEFDNLFGFGDIGLLIGFEYSNSNTSTKTDNGTTKTETNAANWALKADIGWGDMAIGRFDFTPYAYVHYEMNPDGGSQTKSGKDVTADNRLWTLDLGFGGSTVLAKDEAKKSTLYTEIEMFFRNPVDKDFVKTEYSRFELPVTYECVFTPSEKFSFGFGVSAKNYLSFNKNGNTKTTYYSLAPSVYTGFQYNTMKKFIFNAGVDFDVPSFSVNSVKNSSAKTEDTYTCFWGDDASMTVTSGFQFNPVNNLCIDCNWNILADIFDANTLTTNFTEGDTRSLWNTLNKLLVHNITIQISYKF